MEGMIKLKKDYIKYIAALLLFGSNGIIANSIHMESFEIVFLRTMIGSVLLIVLFLVTGGKFTFYKHKKDLLFLSISGISMGASWMFLYEAYKQIGVSLASLLYYCGPVIVMISALLLFKEKLTANKFVGFVIVLCGIVLVNGSFCSAEGGLFGILCGAMSAVMYSLMVIFNKKNTHITGLENSTIQLTISFITVAIFLLCKQGFAISVPEGEWLWVLILGIANTGIGCFLYFSSIGKLPVQTVAICGYLEPLSAVIFSVLLLHEVMLPLQILGAALIVGGALLGELRMIPQKR